MFKRTFSRRAIAWLAIIWLKQNESKRYLYTIRSRSGAFEWYQIFRFNFYILRSYSQIMKKYGKLVASWVFFTEILAMPPIPMCLGGKEIEKIAWWDRLAMDGESIPRGAWAQYKVSSNFRLCSVHCDDAKRAMTGLTVENWKLWKWARFFVVGKIA